MDTKEGKQGRRGGMNWEIGTDVYTLMCIKLMTNNGLLNKKINKIKLKKKKVDYQTRETQAKKGLLVLITNIRFSIMFEMITWELYIKDIGSRRYKPPEIILNYRRKCKNF